MVDVYYMYRLAATCTPQSSQGTSEAWQSRVDYELLNCYNDKFFHEKWGSSGCSSRPASDGPEIYCLTSVALWKATGALYNEVNHL